MAIQWADDFSRYGTGSGALTNMVDGLPWGNLGTISGGEVAADPDPNESGRVYLIGANGNNWDLDMRMALPTVVTAGIGVATRFWIGSLPSTDNNRPSLIQFQDGSGNIEVYIRVEQNGSLQVICRVLGTLTVVADTVNPVVTTNAWNHFEFTFDDSAGTGVVYLNGVQILSYTGVDTGNQIELVNMSRRNGSDTGPSVYVKDFVVWDSTGSQNNTLAGTVVVRTLLPDGDQTLGGWTTSTGLTGFDLINETSPNDSDYIQAGDPPPAASEFTLEDLPPDITSVRAVLPVVRARKTDGGDGRIQSAVTADGVNYDSGADRPVTTAFTYYFDVSEIDPADSNPWTPIDVDAMRLRIDRTI